MGVVLLRHQQPININEWQLTLECRVQSSKISSGHVIVSTSVDLRQSQACVQYRSNPQWNSTHYRPDWREWEWKSDSWNASSLLVGMWITLTALESNLARSLTAEPPLIQPFLFQVCSLKKRLHQCGRSEPHDVYSSTVYTAKGWNEPNVHGDTCRWFVARPHSVAQRGKDKTGGSDEILSLLLYWGNVKFGGAEAEVWLKLKTLTWWYKNLRNPVGQGTSET